MFAFFQADADLHRCLEQSLTQVLADWAIAPNQLAVTWLVYDPPVVVNTGGALSAAEFWQHPPRGASYRGVELIPPGDLAQLIYLTAAQDWLEQGMLTPSAELDRALQAMMLHGSYDATSLVIDALTGTTSGPELPPGPYETWMTQRNLVNRYLRSLHWPEFDTTNVNQKLWHDGPYGRERIFSGDRDENANLLTTNALARLLHSIIGGVTVSAARSQAMMALLHRSGTAARQGWLGQVLPPESQIWSKPSWSRTSRHEAAYIEVPGRSPYLLVVMATGASASQNHDVLPALSAALLNHLPAESPPELG